MATCSALYAREATGLGQRVDTLCTPAASRCRPVKRSPAPTSWLWSKSITSQRGINPAYQLYECQDGWLFLACGNDVFWNKLCIALGIEHLVEDPRFENAPWNVPVEHRDDLVSIIGGILRERPRAHWLEFLAEHDVPTAPVMSREQFYEHPQVAHTQALTEVDDPALGPTRQMGMSVILHESPGSVGGPAPPAGRHTREVLYELGYGPEEVDRLSGLGVVRLTNGRGPHDRAAKPSSGGQGDRPGGVHRRGLLLDPAGRHGRRRRQGRIAGRGRVSGARGSFQAWNRGKRAMILNLASPEGRSILHRMVADADVVVENYRKGAAEKLGADYDTLRAVNPRIIYCSVTGYGLTGPYSSQPGFDPLLQAQSGAMTTQGGRAARPSSSGWQSRTMPVRCCRRSESRRRCYTEREPASGSVSRHRC